MKRVFCTLFLTIAAAGYAAGQNTTDYKKTEFYVGYSNGQVDNGGGTSAGALSAIFGDRQTFHGFEGSGVYNFTRYVGVKADVSGTYKSIDFSTTFTDPVSGTGTTFTGSNNYALYNVLGGIQIKDNSTDKKVKPFAHAMAGIAHFRTSVKDFACTPAANCGQINFANQTFTDTEAAGAFGGGLDARLNDRFDLRVIQLDYNPIWTADGTSHNFRFGFGLLIK